MPRADLLIVRGSIASRVPRAHTRSAAYRAYRADVTRASSYEALLTLLEQVTADTASRRFGVIIDFAPAADYARRFLNSTAAYRSLPPDDHRRHLAERAVRVLNSLQNVAGARRERAAAPRLDPATAASIMRTRAEWQAVIAPIWRAAGPDRSRLTRAVEMAIAGRVPTAAAYRHDLLKLLKRRHLRQIDLVTQLTAWQLQTSVRRVRAASAAQHLGVFSA
jgi:hypothetical protein